MKKKTITETVETLDISETENETANEKVKGIQCLGTVEPKSRPQNQSGK